ncbi:MAG TPA: DUF839 domain-containing protein [Burkholderiaceae bacterium]|nr:DUF839 domain-containing protein [Rhodoferax sp.]HQX57616.1 DUF839 domain-containing protein [Burkholderiaceae bacterium]HQZ04528.1 DUF839 domain-containing protein [Burkholderiaceae bacterium]
MNRLHPIAAALSLALVSQVSLAATTNFSTFTPLGASVPAGSLPESAPFLLGSPNFSQVSIADRAAQLANGQFNSGNWDMIDTNRTGPDAGRYLYTVFETGQSGIQRYDRQSGKTITMWAAPAAAPASNSAIAFDASRWTPFGTYLTAEESWGSQPQPYGRLFELTNPTAANGIGNVVHHNAIARVSHEGLAFDKNNNLYFIDELNGGSIYRYSSATPTNGSTYFNGGVNSVLRIGDGNTPNATGSFSWVAFTDATGTGLAGAVTITDPNGIVSVDGRATTNVAAYKGTDYQRPEDLEIQTLANGDQILYVATTTTNEVYSMNLATGMMNTFVSRSTIDLATGLAVGNALTSPDNLAIDAAGNIYIVEDQPGGAADIWFANDANRDGIAESVARWATLSTVGAEPTGLYFDVTNPNIAFVNVQHPGSGVDRMIQITAAVPEPETYAMLLAGLGLIGTIVRRRRRK